MNKLLILLTCFLFNANPGYTQQSPGKLTDEERLNIPGFKNQVQSARLLALKNKIKTSAENETLMIQLPKKAPNKIASVVKVEVKGKL